METLICRWLPYHEANGPWNMAADEALLEAAIADRASFRLYGWNEATLSLGYFQPARLRLDDPRISSLPWVRRPTGGQALVHHYEMTYALALPARAAWQPVAWQERMHDWIRRALAELGVRTTGLRASEERPFDGLLCFQHPTAGDLMMGAHKIVGSAQRRRRGALLQHGGILLAASPYAPHLLGIRETHGVAPDLTEFGTVLRERLECGTGWRFEASEWCAEEQQRIGQLVVERYSQPAWNAKR